MTAMKRCQNFGRRRALRFLLDAVRLNPGVSRTAVPTRVQNPACGAGNNPDPEWTPKIPEAILVAWDLFFGKEVKETKCPSCCVADLQRNQVKTGQWGRCHVIPTKFGGLSQRHNLLVVFNDCRNRMVRGNALQVMFKVPPTRSEDICLRPQLIPVLQRLRDLHRMGDESLEQLVARLYDHTAEAKYRRLDAPETLSPLTTGFMWYVQEAKERAAAHRPDTAASAQLVVQPIGNNAGDRKRSSDEVQQEDGNGSSKRVKY